MGDRGERRMHGTAARPHETAVTTEIPGGPAAAMTARELVTELVGDETAADTMHDLLLLTTELVTNAVIHAGVDEDSTLCVHVESTPALRRVAVVDPGGATIPQVQDLDVSVPGGMGLFLVQQLSTRWGAERDGDGTRVWFELAA